MKNAARDQRHIEPKGIRMYENTIDSRSIYRGRILDLDVLDIEMENGTRAIREIVRHKGAVAALAMLPDERFVAVRQFRKAVEEEVLEAIAGILEDNEESAAAMRREIREETGYDTDALVPLGRLYPSPGYTGEYIDTFFAYLKPDQHLQNQDDDERVEVVYFTEQEMHALIGRGELYDAKLLAIWACYLTIVKNPQENLPECEGCCCARD
jgi:ADP-ribose pyrophosphatase